MLSEILKIRPKLDMSDLRKMERALNTRFRRVAKRFGKGIMAVFKAGGAASIVLTLINRFLNPLKEVQDSIERMLKSSDDLATNAQTFETTTGKLFKLSQLAKASGLDQDTLFQILSKYQVALGRVRANPNDALAPSIGAYSNDQDLVDSFFRYIQDLRSLDQKDQALVKSTVFGEDMAIKLNDFMQQDFGKRLKETGLDRFTADEITKALNKNASLSDLNDALMVGVETKDIMQKANQINEEMIRANARSRELELSQERQRITAYKDLRQITDTVTMMMTGIEKLVQMLGQLIGQVAPQVQRLVELAQQLINRLPKFNVKSWNPFSDD